MVLVAAMGVVVAMLAAVSAKDVVAIDHSNSCSCGSSTSSRISSSSSNKCYWAVCGCSTISIFISNIVAVASCSTMSLYDSNNSSLRLRQELPHRCGSSNNIYQ